MAAISVVVITYNEEQNIERCLRSLSWADEIIVVDSFSTDRTVDLARKVTPLIFQHAYDGDIPQRERGFARAKSDWLLYVDADEEVSAELRDEILETLSSPGGFNGYEIPRKVFILGRWIRHGGWFPDYTLRLFRKTSYHPEFAEVHGGFAVGGEKGRLNGFLNHYTYNSLEQYIAKMNDYTSLQVSNKLRTNRKPVHVLKLFFSPLSHFFRKYVSNSGYKDGMIGFVLAGLGAISTLALYAKLWEYQMRTREGAGNLPPITNVDLQQFRR